MREIKFRAWDKNLKKMFWGKFGERPPTHCEQLYITLDGRLRESHRGLLDEEVEGMALLQYTGLKDKNGKEIYEGDIVKAEDCGTRIGVVRYGYGNDEIWGGFMIEGDYSFHPHRQELEVIGNCYENPELMEKK